MARFGATFVVAALLSAGCGGDGADVVDAGPADAGSIDAGGADANPLIMARPYQWRVPASYDPLVPTPLVLLLHGYSFSGPFQDLYFRLGAQVDAMGFLYAYPDGTARPPRPRNGDTVLVMDERQVEDLIRKLKKRGFITDAVREHCPECKLSAMHVYRLVGRIGGRDIHWCLNCGVIRSYRRSAADKLVEDEGFDLVKFLQ